MKTKTRASSGVRELDKLLGGLFIGDNVVWYDDAGSLASVFCLNFIRISQKQTKPVVYVTFDRSPRNLLEKLGPLGENPSLIVLDCFTRGKGAGSDIFLKFYDEGPSLWPCRIILVEAPGRIQEFMDALYGIHATLEGDVRFVFESITGMQELWGGEDQVSNFYSHSCPRLYELNTIAYWVMEKNAHSHRLRAQINQIAQVAIDLSIKRGTTSLTVLKAENRSLDTLHEPHTYWTRDQNVVFDKEKGPRGGIDLGLKLKELRTKRGVSQSELARLVGVTPSTISQVESNLIYPSLPALLKIAEVLSVDVPYFFQEKAEPGKGFVFPASEAAAVKLSHLPEESVHASSLAPLDSDFKSEPYLIEIAPGQTLSSHFFIHKGEEMGYLLSGRLQFTAENNVHTLREGDTVVLTSEIPTQWTNPAAAPARLLWIKIK